MHDIFATEGRSYLHCSNYYSRRSVFMRACRERSRRNGFAAEAAPTHGQQNFLIS
jgi:hypothetical protein